MGGGRHGGHGDVGGPDGAKSASHPTPPRRYLVASSLFLSKDSLGNRSLDRIDTAAAKALTRPGVSLKLVDQSNGRAVWHGSTLSDGLPGGTCPGSEVLQVLARKATRTALDSLPQEESAP